MHLEMNETILGLVIIASIFIGYFISIALVITPFYKSKANNYLSLSLFLIASNMVIGFFSINSIVFTFLDNIVIDLLLGVIIFSYFLIHIKHTFLNTKYYKWLYAPFIISMMLEISITFSECFLDIHNPFFDILVINIKDITSISFNLFLIFYGRKLILNSKNILDDKRRWLLKFNSFIICIITSFAFAWIEEYVFNTIYIYSILWILLGLFFWWFLYYGILRLQIIVQKEEIHNYLVSKKTPIVLSKKNIKSSTTSKIVSQLYKLMEKEEVYKDPLLSRLDLATKLDISEGYLSQIINQEINKSVIQFVNEYRIEAAKKHILIGTKIHEVAHLVGYTDYSYFSRVFRQSVGESPKTYQKNHRKTQK